MTELRQLRYFVAIVDAGSLTRAASVLHVAQPALSQQVAALEEEIGVRLLTRSVRGVTPTDAGRAVYRHAQSLLKLAAQTRDLARGASEAVCGRVRLGLPSSIAMILAAPLLAALHQRYPGVLVELYESPSTYVGAQLLDERVDLAVLVDTAPAPGLFVQPLVEECVYFVHARAGHPLPRARTVALERLRDVPMILTTRATTLRQMVDAAFEAAGIAPPVRAEASSIQTLLTVVAGGGVGTLIPFSALSWHPATRDLRLTLVEPSIARRASLAWSRSTALTQAAECTRIVIGDVVAEMVRSRKWHGATACA